MIRKLDRIAIVAISGLVGLMAVIPGWQIMTDGSVYGFKLPTDWLTSYWPFGGYFVAGMVLLVAVGGGGIATALVNLVRPAAGDITALGMGLVLVGWIAGELVFMNQTMFLTWVILGAGVALIALPLPYLVSRRGESRIRGPQATA